MRFFPLLLNPLFSPALFIGLNMRASHFVFADKAIHVFDFNLFYVRMPKEKNDGDGDGDGGRGSSFL